MITIGIQILGGLCLILGRNLTITSLTLFVLTIIINIFFIIWAHAGDPTLAHEIQNFVKNLVICAGLLVLSTKDGS